MGRDDFIKILQKTVISNALHLDIAQQPISENSTEIMDLFHKAVIPCLKYTRQKETGRALKYWNDIKARTKYMMSAQPYKKVVKSLFSIISFFSFS